MYHYAKNMMGSILDLNLSTKQYKYLFHYGTVVRATIS